MPVAISPTDALRLVESWRIVAAARGSPLEVNHRQGASPEPPTNSPTKTARGWNLSYSDGTGAHVYGPDPVVVDLYLPTGHSVDAELLRRQGPFTALVVTVCGFTAIHAAGIQTPRGLIAVAAPSGAGKSTLASLAHSAGWPVAGDDLLAMDDDLTVLPLPGSLRADAPWVIDRGQPGADGRITIPLEPIPGEARLKSLVTLVRGREARLEPVRGAERLAILADAMLAEFLGGREEKMLNLAAGIPVYRLRVPDSLGRLRSSWPRIGPLLVEACG